MREYWRFFRRETPLTLFGLSFTYLSSWGQTFLVSLFVPHFVQEFALTEAGFGTLYSGATLTSALLLPWVGQWMDRVRLDRFTLGVVLLLALSSFLVAGAWHLAALAVAVLGIRLGGQGLSSHTALTAMARYYDEGRGKALSITNLGYPLGEGTLPLVLTAAIGWVGWRASWIGMGVAALLAAPLLVRLLHRSGVELDPGAAGSSPADPGQPGVGAPSTPGTGHWRRREVLTDVRFWCVLPVALLPAFWVTGFFLYQTTIAELKGWSLALMASAFTAFAAVRIAFTLGVGEGIDRLSARRLVPLTVLPMGLGIALLWQLDAIWVSYAFMALLGVTMGVAPAVQTALWAELYGTRYLGGIKSMMSSLVVLSTAASPALVGFALEGGPGLDGILVAGVVSVAIGALLAIRVVPGPWGRKG